MVMKDFFTQLDQFYDRLVYEQSDLETQKTDASRRLSLAIAAGDTAEETRLTNVISELEKKLTDVDEHITDFDEYDLKGEYQHAVDLALSGTESEARQQLKGADFLADLLGLTTPTGVYDNINDTIRIASVVDHRTTGLKSGLNSLRNYAIIGAATLGILAATALSVGVAGLYKPSGQGTVPATPPPAVSTPAVPGVTGVPPLIAPTATPASTPTPQPAAATPPPTSMPASSTAPTAVPTQAVDEIAQYLSGTLVSRAQQGQTVGVMFYNDPTINCFKAVLYSKAADPTQSKSRTFTFGSLESLASLAGNFGVQVLPVVSQSGTTLKPCSAQEAYQRASVDVFGSRFVTVVTDTNLLPRVLTAIRSEGRYGSR
ncbi:MAG TPA: hypothetical protein VI934_01415 [Candidatus Nanoarchaeia archaeon]|nr:hypothetical protein [Candidatus Nanoarchaeia archaeon]